MEKINLKIKKSAVLEVVEIIIILYAIFLFFLGIIIKNTEVVLEVMIMFVVTIIFNYLNTDFLIVKKEKIITRKYGTILYEQIEKIKIEKYIIEIKLKNVNKKQIIYLSHSNSKDKLSKFNKYVTSKINKD